MVGSRLLLLLVLYISVESAMTLADGHIALQYAIMCRPGSRQGLRVGEFQAEPSRYPESVSLAWHSLRIEAHFHLDVWRHGLAGRLGDKDEIAHTARQVWVHNPISTSHELYCISV